ncbi:MAG: hypothetical protein WCX12_02580 [Candidatus Paceibacterota bacterium]|jgi:hypothetical protein
MNSEVGEPKISGGEKEIVNPMKGGETESPPKIFLEQSFGDQKDVGSSFGSGDLESHMRGVEKKMRENQTATVGELMSEEEIRNYILGHEKALKELREKISNHQASGLEEKTYLEGNSDFKRMIFYLNEINRLPKEFEHYL